MNILQNATFVKKKYSYKSTLTNLKKHLQHRHFINCGLLINKIINKNQVSFNQKYLIQNQTYLIFCYNYVLKNTNESIGNTVDP